VGALTCVAAPPEAEKLRDLFDQAKDLFSLSLARRS